MDSNRQYSHTHSSLISQLSLLNLPTFPQQTTLWLTAAISSNPNHLAGLYRQGLWPKPCPSPPPNPLQPHLQHHSSPQCRHPPTPTIPLAPTSSNSSSHPNLTPSPPPPLY